MFDLSTNHLIQLLVALGGGLSLFVLSHMGFQRLLFKALVIIIPFQFLNSKYGSFNMAFTYVLGASMFLNQSWIKKKTKENWPLILPFVIIIFAFLLSWTQAPRMFWGKNIFYMIMLGSNVFLFYMAYHFVSDRDDVVTLFNLLLFCNVLVIIYCVFQMIIGFDEYSFLGIKEFSFQANLEEKRRLVGPFNAVGITAEYLVIQCVLLTYYVLNGEQYRKVILFIILCNVAALIGTGNRGGFISFLLSFLLFIYFFRKRLGVQKTVAMFLAWSLMLTAASYIMIKHTDFNVIYERLMSTEVKGFTPDTRSGWPFVVEKILEKPVLGHGPRLVTVADYDKPMRWPKGEIGFYPHNLYLYILYSMGLVGFLAYCLWAVKYLQILGKSKRILSENDKLLSGLPKLGIIVFVIFLFDQMKVEFFRWNLLDFQHYLSVLFGMFCGLKKLK